MARVGQFGRRPRIVQSLSDTIVSMLREYNNLIDRNMLEAWEKGGLVDGKKVTDDRILAHFRERRSGISKDDPLWDYYDNLVREYGYTIRESKMSLRYAQHKISEGQMANFYRTEARKLPRQSEAYRQLMRNAAAFVDRSRSGAAGSASASNARAYARARDNQMLEGGEIAYDTATGYLLRVARDQGILTMNQDLDDLALGLENDPDRMLGLIEYLNSKLMEGKGVKGSLYWTLKRTDPNGFDGQFTIEYLNGLSRRAANSAKKRIGIADKYGYKTEADAAAKKAGEIVARGKYIGGWDEAEAYSEGRALFHSRMKMAKTYAERNALRGDYAVFLEGLAAGLPSGSAYLGPLNEEIRAARGQGGHARSLHEDLANTSRADLADDAELPAMNAWAVADAQAAEEMKSGDSYLVQGEWEPGGKGQPPVFRIVAGGRQLATAGQVAASGIDVTNLAYMGLVPTTRHNPDGSTDIVYLKTKPIRVTATSGDVATGTNPVTGEPSSAGYETAVTGKDLFGNDTNASQVVGEMVVGVDGRTQYRPYTADGKGEWTWTDPWSKDYVRSPGIHTDDAYEVVMYISNPEDIIKGYDPSKVFDKTFTDPSLPNSFRTPLLWLADKMQTDEGRNELANTEPQVAAQVAKTLSGGDADMEMAIIAQFTAARDRVLGGEALYRINAAIARGEQPDLSDINEWRQQDIANAPANALPFLVGLGPTLGPDGVVADGRTLVSEEDARARATAALKAAGYNSSTSYRNPQYSKQVDISKTPAIQLPSIVERLTGKTPDWMVGSSYTPPTPQSQFVTTPNVNDATGFVLPTPPPASPKSPLLPSGTSSKVKPADPKKKPKPPKIPPPPVVTLPSGETGVRKGDRIAF